MKTIMQNGYKPCPICKSADKIIIRDKNAKEAEILCKVCGVSVVEKSNTRMVCNGIEMWLIDFQQLIFKWNKLSNENN